MRYRNFGAFLLAVPLSAAAFSMGKPETVSANSAPPYWNGSDGMGAILAGDRCPIEVEREHLRFSLTEFPAWEESAENFANYSGKFTAEYTFFNPTDSAVELSLVFPFGVLPDYYPYDEELDRASFGYAIRLDGADVPYTLRHTLDGQPYARGSSFDLEKGLERLYSSRKPFYFDDLPVKTYTYSIDAASLSDGGDVCYANFSLSFAASAERTRVLCLDHCSYGIKDGRAKLTYSFDCSEQPVQFTVYVLGEDISAPETHVFRYENGRIVSYNDASVTVASQKSATFSDFALSFRPEGSAVSDGDWKNAFIDAIEEGRYLKTCCSDFTPSDLKVPAALMQWFEYSISVPAGGRAVNSVTAPIYPTMDGSHSQDLYFYRYLLSPAQKWAKFGQITVDIDTPYFISDSSLAFTAREGGYTLTRNSLPLGELAFTLSEQERQFPADMNWTYNGDGGDLALVTAIVILCVVAAGAAAIITVLVLQSKKKRKRREEEEKKLLQARPQEGKIDLPEDDNKSS